MRASFESIYAALFALAEATPGIRTASRRLVSAQDVPVESSPALYQVQIQQKAEYQGTTPTAWDLHAMWIVVVAQTDETQPMTPALNPILDAITATFAPAPPFGKQTLGGLVEYAGIEGNIDISEGVMGDRTVAFIPIHIIVPGF